MLYFIRKYRALLFATALLFSGLVILTGTHENRRDLGFLDKLALDLTGFFAGLLSNVGAGISGLWFDYVYLVGVRDENAVLKSENDRLKLERTALEEAVFETDRLRRALGFRERTGFTAVPASVIGADVSGWFRTFTIDRGSRDGVERGFAVVSPDGVVGRTYEVASRTTKVLLITDSNSAVDAILQRTRGRGVIYGRVTTLLEMRYVHRTEEVAQGDVVLTSGVGGVFPKGLPIGVVTRVDDSSTGLFKTVEVVPAADLSRIEDVLVVTAHAARDFEPLVSPLPDAATAAAQAAAVPAATPAPVAAPARRVPVAAPPAVTAAPVATPAPVAAPARRVPVAAPSAVTAAPVATPAPVAAPARRSPVAAEAAAPAPVATPAPAARPASVIVAPADESSVPPADVPGAAVLGSPER